jgi:DNA mismatch repair protein PMS2
MIDNISCVFGPKQLESIVPIVTQYNNDESVTVHDNDIRDDIKINGYISKCHHGNGRSSTDRQFLYFNGRPCDHIKLNKTINEVYHMYNQQQYPFVVMNINMSRNAVDVNVTPDKRQVMVRHEEVLLTIVKELLMTLFDSMARQVQPSSVVSCNKRPSSSSSIEEVPRTKQLRLMDLEKFKSSSVQLPKPGNRPATPTLIPVDTPTRTLVDVVSPSCDSGIEVEQTSGSSPVICYDDVVDL